MIKETSGSHMDPAFLARLETFGATVLAISTPAANQGPGDNALAAVEQACMLADPAMTPAKRAASKLAQGKQAMLAGAEAHAMYLKHLVPAADTLVRRMRFDRRNAPDQIAGGVYTYAADWYGCLPLNYGPAINAQWGLSVVEWWGKTAPDPAGVAADHPKFYWAKVKTYDYWTSKLMCWKELAEVALWWSEVQTSSIDAERVIALGRVIDVPSRRGQSWAAFKREVAFKVHADDLDVMLTASSAKMI